MFGDFWADVGVGPGGSLAPSSGTGPVGPSRAESGGVSMGGLTIGGGSTGWLPVLAGALVGAGVVWLIKK